MSVKFGDIAKDTNNVFSKDFNDSVKLEDKVKIPTGQVGFLGKWDNGFASKFVYKWALPIEGADAEATAEVAKQTVTPCIEVTKGPWTLTGKQEKGEKVFLEAAAKGVVATGVTAGAVVKSYLVPEMKHSGDVHAAYQTKVSDAKLQLGVKVAADNLTAPKPAAELAVGVLSVPAQLSVKYNVNKNTVKSCSLFGVPLNLFGYCWKLGHLLDLKDSKLDNYGGAVVAKKHDLTIKAKVDKLNKEPETSVSFILNSKLGESKKETLTTVATWGFAGGNHKFGFSASRS
eukprot:TRINITY_DN1494_c0_g3_i2.p1 TRINITY_DN1494_c0_g3~~TRINITY_DN1494_c0_g3_i2.p1  ORF type:complete len:310 (+),score=134.93 TRINITY_DN1494_c0_g3_i2:71-931(+)